MSSYNGVKINKVKITSKLTDFAAGTERKCARVALQALIIGGSESAPLTPIAFGNLINSRYNHVSKEGDSILGRTGYTAAYAQPVNDPDHPQKFRRASATKDFLKKGFENAKENIDAMVVRELKV